MPETTDDLRERPIGELVKDLSQQTSTLVRKEIELAQAELSQKGKVAGKGVGMLAGAAVAGLLALGALRGLVSELGRLVLALLAQLLADRPRVGRNAADPLTGLGRALVDLRAQRALGLTGCLLRLLLGLLLGLLGRRAALGRRRAVARLGAVGLQRVLL